MFFLFFNLINAFDVKNNTVQVLFTPQEKCLPKIIHLINSAKKTIYLQCYSFTSKPIAKALLDAKDRGVSIKIISDKSQIKAKGSVVIWLAKKDIPVFIDNKVAIAHNKVIVIDDEIVLSGSYNWTNSAENRNAENLIIFHNKNLASKFISNFNSRKDASVLIQRLLN